MITKGEIVRGAVDFLALGGVVLDVEPEDESACLRMLEMMIPAWERKGLLLGYSLEEQGIVPKLESDAGIKDTDFLAVSSNLAIKMCPYFSIMPSQDQRATAKNAFRDLYSTEPVQRKQNPMQPTGQGDRRYGTGPRFMPRDKDEVEIPDDGTLDLGFND